MASDLKNIVGDSPKLSKIVGGLTQAGAPVSSRIGYLLLSDVGAQKIMKWQGGAVTVFREHSNGANGLTFDHQGRLLAAEKERVTRTEKDGKITVLAQQSAADVVYAIDGNIYFSGTAAVHRVHPKSGAVIASRDCERPAGVALSPDQQKLYVADAGERNIRVFDIAADGALLNGRVFAAMKSGPAGGLKTDESGRVWVAGPGAILVFDKDGHHLGSISVPELPINLNWGEGFHNLFVTAGTSVYRIEANVHGTRTF